VDRGRPARRSAASAPVKRSAPVKKAVAAKKAVPVKKSAPTRVSVAGKKASPAKKAAASKTTAPVKKSVSANKAGIAKKSVAKKSVAVKKAAPAKKAVAAKKSAPPRKAAPAKKATATKPAPALRKAAAPTKAAKAASAKAAPVKAAPVKAAPVKAAPAKTVAPPRPVAAVRAAAAPADTPVRVAKPGATVLPGERPWTKSELAKIRIELDSQAAALRGEISEAEQSWAALQRDSGEGAGDDQADAGTKTFEREHEMSLAANSRDLLSQVERALQRLDDRTYGICESCGNPIGKGRLQAFPRATLCVSCKQREERR
jgi:RNA polymerase-binding protein DksA